VRKGPGKCVVEELLYQGGIGNASRDAVPALGNRTAFPITLQLALSALLLLGELCPLQFLLRSLAGCFGVALCALGVALSLRALLEFLGQGGQTLKGLPLLLGEHAMARCRGGWTWFAAGACRILEIRRLRLSWRRLRGRFAQRLQQRFDLRLGGQELGRPLGSLGQRLVAVRAKIEKIHGPAGGASNPGLRAAALRTKIGLVGDGGIAKAALARQQRSSTGFTDVAFRVYTRMTMRAKCIGARLGVG
ncbi:MAG TPA: hypothetical protein VNZ53_46530, partial [Steroidobacteraceae bacterium]|nr:hypothetical protein [Steroidobacteraceae bacterium]